MTYRGQLKHVTLMKGAACDIKLSSTRYWKRACRMTSVVFHADKRTVALKADMQSKVYFQEAASLNSSPQVSPAVNARCCNQWL